MAVDILPESLSNWLHSPVLGLAVWRYLVATLVIIVTFSAKKAFEVVFVRWFEQMFAKTHLRYDRILFEALNGPLRALLIVTGIYSGMMVLALGGPGDLVERVTTSLYVAIGLLAMWAAYRLVDVLAQLLDDVAQRKSSPLDRQFVPFIVKSTRIFVVVVGSVTVMQLLEWPVTSLLTGLGLGGLAISLAAQDTLGSLLGSIVLLADRPFKVGDWVVVGDKINGFVEAIGLRSTKIRTWPRTLMTIPNKVLANEMIDNWSQMSKRRVYTTINLEYGEPEQIEQLLEDVREILSGDEGIDQEYHLAHWTEFGPYSVQMMLYYFTKATAWRPHLECRERVNLKILRASRSRGLQIAIPTSNVHLRGHQTPPAPDISYSAKPHNPDTVSLSPSDTKLVP